MDRDGRARVAVAIDPGGVTGMACVAQHEDGTFALLDWVEISSIDEGMNELRAARAVAQKAAGWVAEYGADVVAIEDFIIRLGVTDRSLLSPVRMTAMIEAFWYEMRGSGGIGWGGSWGGEYVKQQASSAKAVATNERLKRWGLWVKGKQHARDAIRHCVVALRTRAAAGD